MSSIWFTSDTHFHHKNLVKGVTGWDLSKEGTGPSVREFKTLEEHDYTLVKNINDTVRHNDILWHLGDWSFGGQDNIEKFRNQLNCRTINLIFGNHDQLIEPENSQYRNLFNTCQYYKEITHGGVKLILSHYAFRVWNGMHRGSVNLYGHSHGSLSEIGKSMDVGIDTNNMYPYHINSIIELMNKKDINTVDHHIRKNGNK